MKFRNSPFFAVFLAAAAAVLPVRADTLAPACPIVIHRLPDGLRYGLMGERPGPAAPTILVLAGSLELMQKEGHYTALGRIMAGHGFLCVVLDPPAHGEDRRAAEGEGMEGALLAWRQRIDAGEDLAGYFNRRAGRVLDELIRQGKADPARIGAFGISRGGYLAFHLAAADPRIRFAAAMSPLIEPHALTEFAHDPHMDRARAASALRIAPKLAGRPIWIGVSNDDMRVDVDRVIAFARSIIRASAAGKEANPVIPVEMIFGPASASGGRGHYAVDEGNGLLANWILKLYGMPETVPLELSARE